MKTKEEKRIVALNRILEAIRCDNPYYRAMKKSEAERLMHLMGYNDQEIRDKIAVALR